MSNPPVEADYRFGRGGNDNHGRENYATLYHTLDSDERCASINDNEVGRAMTGARRRRSAVTVVLTLLVVSATFGAFVGHAAAVSENDLSGVDIAYCADRNIADWYTDTIVSDLENRGASVTVITALSSESLQSYDVLWIDEDFGSGEGCTLTEEGAVQTFVQNGGGGLMVHGDDLSTTALSIINGYGMSPGIDGLGGSTSNLASHPTTTGVETMELPTSGGTLSISDSVTALVRDAEGAPAIAAATSGDGRVVVARDDYMIDSYFASADNRLFFNQAFDWLAGAVGDSGPDPAPTTSLGANFEVVELSVDKTTAYKGEPVSVTLTVENRGGSVGTYHALLTTMDEILRSERVELQSGESHTFEWTLRFDKIDNPYLILNHRTFERLDIVARPPPELASADVEVVDSYLTRSTVWPGETYEVVSVVKNVGNETGTATIRYATMEAGSGSNTTDSTNTNTTNTTNATNTTNTTNATSTELEATQSVVLAPNETAERRHTVTVSSPVNSSENRTWLVNGVLAGNVSVLSADAVGSGVVDAYVRPRDVSPSATYEVVAVVHNADTVEKGVVVAFTADDDSPGTVKNVRVGPGETVLVERSVTAPDAPGTSVVWNVSGHTATVEITSDD